MKNKIIMNYDYTAEILEKIAQGKKLFYEKDEDPGNIPYLCPEVAESWIRSKQYGVNPFEPNTEKTPERKEIQKLLKENKLLLQTAIPFIRKFLPFLSISDYIMTLTDQSGVILFSTKDQQRVNDSKKLIGVCSSEEKEGTTATSLSIRHKCPVQLIGPNNYLLANGNDIVSSAPILKSDDEVMGTLLIIQSYGDLSKSQKILAHTLGWVTSMAEAIAKQLEIKLKNQLLETAYKIIDTTLSVIEQGVITLDGRGMITNINKKALDMLNITPSAGANCHYTKYFGQTPYIGEVLRKGCAVHDIEVTLTVNSYEQKYIISIDPIGNDQEHAPLQGAVICMTQSARIDKLVGNRGGIKAHYSFRDIKGESEVLLKTLQFARQIAKTNVNILLVGESGTGKELFAQAIHNNYCAEGPFIAINCASMPRTLIESELFGYEGGAFTGAEKKGRPGKFELANDGTLFLDEIGDMPIEIQPVLLRVLENRQMMRIGGTKYIPVNARIIAATNRDLLAMVKNNQFREDLYFRLAVFKMEIPPLRIREKDALILAHYFLEEVCQKLGKRPPEITADARKLICKYTWPGNARQLENAIVYAVYMCNGETITVRDLPPEITTENSLLTNNKELMSIAELEKEAIIKTMRHTRNDTAQAAEILGMGRTTLYKKIKDYAIEI